MLNAHLDHHASMHNTTTLQTNMRQLPGCLSGSLSLPVRTSGISRDEYHPTNSVKVLMKSQSEYHPLVSGLSSSTSEVKGSYALYTLSLID